MSRQKYLPGPGRSDFFDELVVRLDVAHWRFARYRRRRHQRDVAAPERAVDERFLPVAGDLQHFVPDPSERQAYVEAGDRQILQQRGSEGTVIAIAIISR